MSLVLQKSQTEGVNVRYTHNNKEGTAFSAQAGDIFTATITGKTSKKTSLQAVDYSNYAFEAAAGSVKGEVGQQVSFQVLKNDKDDLVLKQVLTRQEAAKTANASVKQQALTDIKELLKQNHIIKEENVLKPEDRVEEQIKTMKAVAKLRRQLSYPAANASLSVINELAAEGISLGKITLSVLNSVMKEIEAKPVKEISQEELSRLVDDYFSKTEASQEDEGDIVEALASHDLPATESNVKALKKTLRQASETAGLGEEAIGKLIQKETPLTLEALYIARFSSAGSTGKENLTQEDWQALLPEIYKALEHENMENTAENLEAARFLVENSCPITKENIQKRSFLQHIEERIDRRELLLAAAKNIKQDKPVTDIPLYGASFPEQDPGASGQEELYENYCSIIETLPKVTTGDISGLIQRGQTLTLNAFRTLYAENNARVQVVRYHADSEASEATLITAKRQLTEIALKLTHEAAYRLSQKNIRIDTVPLSQALEGLKNLESEGYGKNLRAMGNPSDDGAIEEKKALMADLYEKLRLFKPDAIRQVSGEILYQRVGFTVNGVHAYLREAYDRQQTPNLQYGDSFKKVENQFASLLERLGIEASEENIRAAAILSRNERDVTDENLTKIKVIDYKLNRLVDSLHPNIAASMIKEGYNPVEMPIDEILDYIKGFEQVYGNSLKDKITENILKLDESHSVEQSVRESMIAFYRMLSLIEKNGGAALGMAMENKANPTLGDLMEASKTYTKAKKGERLDYIIDDGFGGLARLIRPDTNIRSVLENREKQKLSAGREYQSQLLTDLGELSAPDKLQNLLQQPDFYDRTLEDAVRELKENNGQTEQIDRETADFQARQLQSLANVSPAVLQALASYDISPTLNNIFALQNLEKYVSSLRDVVNSMEDSEEKDALIAEISGSGLEGWIEEADSATVLDSLAEKIEELKEAQTSRTRFRELTFIQNALQLQKVMYGNGSSLQLPVKLRDGISSLNLYIVNKEVKDEMKIFMSLSTKALGEVQAQIVTNGDSAGLLLSAETREGLASLRERSASMGEYMEGVPVRIDEIRFTTREEGASETLFDKNNKYSEKTGQSLSFKNASSKNIKKLVSAIVRMIDI